MKFTTVIGAAIIFISGTALAYSYDVTKPDVLIKAHQTSPVVVQLPVGNSTVEVWSTGEEKISCTFLDPGTDKSIHDGDTKRCVRRIINQGAPSNMVAKISNDGNQDLNVRIWVHDTTK